VPSGVQFGTMFLGAENISLRSLPKRRPSRLFMFSFMPVASHHVSRCFCMCGRSGGLAMRVVSSANWEILWRTPLVSTPMMFGSCCTRRVSASVMQRKRTELSGDDEEEEEQEQEEEPPPKKQKGGKGAQAPNKARKAAKKPPQAPSQRASKRGRNK